MLTTHPDSTACPLLFVEKIKPDNFILAFLQ